MAKNKIYPFAVASVRAMENKLLTKQKLMQMAEAKNAEEALRLLADTDYGKTQVRDVHDFEEMIQNNLEESYESIQKLIPNETFMNIFLFKNDYHNIKVLIGKGRHAPHRGYPPSFPRTQLQRAALYRQVCGRSH